MDISKIRNDFPILSKEVNGKPLIYFDNACMSLRPRQVMEKMNFYYEEMSACSGRSNHRLAQAVSEAVDAVRVTTQRFIGAGRKEEVIFVRNTTEGLNLVAQSLDLKKGDLVLTSDKEHNSNLVPWLKMVRMQGIVHEVIKSNDDNTFDMEAYDILLEKKPKVVSIVQTSNLDGVTFPIAEIAKRAKRAGAVVMVDAAQSAPHQKIDVKKLGVDFLTFSGHKMLGPSGVGVLWGRYELLEKMDGFMVGGDTVEWTTYDDFELLKPPEKFEAGLQNYAGIMGLGAAIEYLEKVGFGEIERRELELNTYITGELLRMERVELIGPEDPKLRAGIVAFMVDGVDPHQISLLLDQTAGIMVRSGQHCVHSWFNDRNIKGSVRASLYFYNTREEVERFVLALGDILTVV
jgi:cysteine desulfurase / selenocysteine lyase